MFIKNKTSNQNLIFFKKRILKKIDNLKEKKNKSQKDIISVKSYIHKILDKLQHNNYLTKKKSSKFKSKYDIFCNKLIK